MKAPSTFSVIILGLMIVLCLFIYKFGNLLGENKAQIQQLDKENSILKRKNDSIFISIESLSQNKQIDSLKIDSLTTVQDQMNRRYVSLNNKYQNLKGEYEKAKNHAANFNSADIRRYFADSLR